ncbi:prepilin-type N-terminal cleavage/methylation domain-containing protein [Pseudomonas sp. NPDC089996]|uniref:prepilin-type N-terminal cleavage/methylation domain-containing protein n=1 Tax=Pseudomonas sp. NPDC089996 TaxID=3364474 RepID=UPI003827EC4C
MNRQCGFTLLEMLAAIALLVIAASILLGAFAQSGRSLQQVARADRHNSVVRSLIDDVDLGTLEPGRQRGRWQGLAWTLDVSPAAVAPGRVTLFRLDLTLGEGRHASRYSTLRARTTGAAP